MGNVIPFPRARPIDDPLAKTTAWMPRAERWQTGNRWGDLSATGLTAVLAEAAKGNVWDWADLVEYAVGSDDHVQSLYTTRLTRVVQADYQVIAAKEGDPAIAEQAAQLVRELLPKIDNWHDMLRHLLHAVALGYAAGEMRWAYDAVSERHYVERVDLVHAHRFRFDEQWQLRLWDRGLKSGPDGFGVLLDPRFWVTHSHQEVAGYPSKGGVMWACIWRWMFRRWVDKFWIHNVETRGTAFIYALVAPNTTDSVRDKILAQLQRLSADHVGVIEEGGQLKVDATASATKDTAHLDYMNKSEASLTKAWLGISDAVDPGASGSQAAVSTRASAAMDPRMVADGQSLMESIRRTLIRRLVHENGHEFPVPLSQIPIPELKFKTANDEVKLDHGAAASESQGIPALDNGPATSDGTVPATAPAGTPMDASVSADGVPTDGKVQDTALNGAQVTSLVELIKEVALGELPRESAIALVVTAFQVSQQQAEAIVGPAGTPQFVPISVENAQAAADAPQKTVRATRKTTAKIPKAKAPARPGLTSKSTTQQTTLPLSTPIERALRGELEE